MIGKAIVVVVVLLIIFGGGYFFTTGFVLPSSIKETRGIWTPEQFCIANNFDSSSIIGAEFKNDIAKGRSFEDLLIIYNSTYRQENFTITALQNGTIWYVWTFKGEIYKARDRQMAENLYYAFPRYGSLIDISRNDGKAYITVVFNYSSWGVLVVTICYLGIIVLGLFVGWLFYPRSESAKSTNAKK